MIAAFLVILIALLLICWCYSHSSLRDKLDKACEKGDRYRTETAEALALLDRMYALSRDDTALIEKQRQTINGLRGEVEWAGIVATVHAAEVDRLTSRYAWLPTIAGVRQEAAERLAEVVELHERRQG